MIIINAVECKNIGTIQSVVDKYLQDNPTSKLFTDSEQIKKYIDANYESGRCIYNFSLVGMWMQVEENSIIFIVKIHNAHSEVYYDMNNNYPIVCIESSYDPEEEEATGVKTISNVIGVTGGSVIE